MTPRNKSWLHLLAIVGMHAIPIYGLLALGWDALTVVFLYWAETVIFTILNPFQLFFFARRDKVKLAGAMVSLCATGMFLLVLLAQLGYLAGIYDQSHTINWSVAGFMSFLQGTSAVWWSLRWALVGFLVTYAFRPPVSVSNDPLGGMAIFAPLRNIILLNVAALMGFWFVSEGAPVFFTAYIFIVVIAVADIGGAIYDIVRPPFARGIQQQHATLPTMERLNAKASAEIIPVFLLIPISIITFWVWHTSFRQTPIVESVQNEYAIYEEAQLFKDVGTEIFLRGTAQDTSKGAVLFTPSMEKVYIDGLDFWPVGFLAKDVVATGTLRYRDHISGGKQFVLEGAEWEKE